jgi:hypothetical protein
VHDLPPGTGERPDVGLVLAPSEADVDRCALEVRHDALGEPLPRRSDQRHPTFVLRHDL